jgi:hypothetical protein
VTAVQERAWPVNIWDVEDAEDLERALSFGPEAITADLGSIPPLGGHGDTPGALGAEVRRA